MNRRGFLGSILAACAAPAIVKAESIMRVRPLILPGIFHWSVDSGIVVDGWVRFYAGTPPANTEALPDPIAEVWLPGRELWLPFGRHDVTVGDRNKPHGGHMEPVRIQRFIGGRVAETEGFEPSQA